MSSFTMLSSTPLLSFCSFGHLERVCSSEGRFLRFLRFRKTRCVQGLMA